MTELKTLIPKNIIDDCRQQFPRASMRLVVFVATGGINVDHPWHKHSARITANVSRCMFSKTVASIPTDYLAMTARYVLMMMQEIGIVSSVEFCKEGYVVHQNQKWFEAHRSELEAEHGKLGLVHFDGEAAIWATLEPEDEDVEA